MKILRKLFIILIGGCFVYIPAGVSAEDALSLDKCISVGIANNPDLQKLRYDVLIAEQDYKHTLGIYEPSVKVDANSMLMESFIAGVYSEQDALDISISKPLLFTGGFLGLELKNKRAPSSLDMILQSYGVQDTPYQSTLNLSYSQPLLKNMLGVNSRNMVAMVEYKKQISELSLELQKIVLRNKIVKAYWDLSFAAKNLEIQEQTLIRAKKFLKSNKRKFRDGLLEEVDIIATEASITVREAMILQAKDAIENAKDNLLAIINVPVEEECDFDIDYTIKYEENGTVDSKNIVKKALIQRNELKIYETTLKISEINKKIKSNERLPDLNLVAQGGLSGYGNDWQEDFDDLNSLDNKTWYVGLQMELFPFRKKSQSQYEKSDMEFEKSGVDRKWMVTQIKNQCRATVRYVNTMSKYVKANEKAMQLQRKKLELEEKKFNQGRSNSQFILSYQDDLSRAESDYFKAWADYNKALADLDLVIGSN